MSSRDHEYTVKIAEIALEKIKSLSLPADPSSYELWYDYAVGRNPDLNRRINRAIDENGGLPMSEVDGIYNEFMGLSRTRTELKNLSENVSGEIDNVVGILGELILSASESRDNWAEASTRLVDPRDQNTLRAIADALIKSLRAVELKCTALEQRLNASAQEMELLKQALSAVTVEASLDPVTGLPNRRRFDDALEQAIAGANGDGRPFCLLMIDIDHFKRSMTASDT
jgi:diguanylate cyclase